MLCNDSELLQQDGKEMRAAKKFGVTKNVLSGYFYVSLNLVAADSLFEYYDKFHDTAPLMVVQFCFISGNQSLNRPQLGEKWMCKIQQQVQ